MHNRSHHIQPKRQCTSIEKSLSSSHRRFFVLFIRVLTKVSTGEVLRTRLRFEQRLSRQDRAAAERPYSCRVFALRDDNTPVVTTCELLGQKLKERVFIPILCCRQRDSRLG